MSMLLKTYTLDSTAVTGLVLAGGESSRMGQNKAMMRWQGLSLLDHAVHALRPLCHKVQVVGGEAKAVADGHWADAYPNMGPLGGLCTGLTNMTSQWALVLSCDVPLVKPELLQFLLEQRQVHDQAVIARAQGQNHPLIGLYSKKALPVLTASLAQKQYGMQRAVIALPHKLAEIPARWHHQLANINTPQDWQQFL